MKKILFSSLMLGMFIQTSIARTADSKKEDRPYRLLNFGVIAAPEAGYRLVSAKDMTGDLVKDKTLVGEERPWVGFSTGLSIAVHPVKFFGVETGLLFSELNYRTRSITETNGSFTARSRYRTIDVPFRINFYAGNNKTRFIAGLGGSLNAALSSDYLLNSSASNVASKEEAIQGIRKINFTPTLWLGLEHQITKNLMFRFEPVLRMRAINSLEEDAAINAANILDKNFLTGSWGSTGTNYNGKNIKIYQAAVGFNFGFFVGIL